MKHLVSFQTDPLPTPGAIYPISGPVVGSRFRIALTLAHRRFVEQNLARKGAPQGVNSMSRESMIVVGSMFLIVIALAIVRFAF